MISFLLVIWELVLSGPCLFYREIVFFKLGLNNSQCVVRNSEDLAEDDFLEIPPAYKLNRKSLHMVFPFAMVGIYRVVMYTHNHQVYYL